MWEDWQLHPHHFFEQELWGNPSCVGAWLSMRHWSVGDELGLDFHISARVRCGPAGIRKEFETTVQLGCIGSRDAILYMQVFWWFCVSIVHACFTIRNGSRRVHNLCMKVHKLCKGCPYFKTKPIMLLQLFITFKCFIHSS